MKGRRSPDRTAGPSDLIESPDRARSEEETVAFIPRQLNYAALLLHWAPMVVWGALIYSSSGSSANAGPATQHMFMFLLVPDSYSFDLEEFRFHTGAFAVLAVLAYRLLAVHFRWRQRWLVVAAVAVAAGYGALDELHQAFVPGRTASSIDLGYDFLGAALALAAMVATFALIRRIGARGASRLA